MQQQLSQQQTAHRWAEAELSRAAAKESAALSDAKTWQAKYLQAQKDSMPPACIDHLQLMHDQLLLLSACSSVCDLWLLVMQS